MIRIGKGSVVDGKSVLRTEGKGNKITIGSNVYIGNAELFANDSTRIRIGNDCLFSDQIDIQASDGHSIYKENSKINEAKDIVIGRHVWIGRRVQILKGSHISDDSVVGAGTMITKMFQQKNVVIAGNPARIIKEDINWHFF